MPFLYGFLCGVGFVALLFVTLALLMVPAMTPHELEKQYPK